MINRKILVLAAYPIANPQHGGQKRTRAIVDHYRTIFQEVRFIGVFNPDSYVDKSPQDLTIQSATILQDLRNNPFNAAVLTGQAVYDDISIRRSLITTLKQFRPHIIQIEQPFMYRSVKKLVAEAGLRVEYIFSSQNVEHEMKQDTFETLNVPATIYRPIVKYIHEIEEEFSKQAALTIAVSDDDSNKHRAMGSGHCVTVANGIHHSNANKKSLAKWNRYKKNQNLTKVILFVGSAHPPNWRGFEEMVGTSTDFLPEKAKILIVGGVSDYFKNAYQPEHPFWSKAEALGKVDEDDLAALLHTADVIMLPIISGGGSNLKTAEAILSGKKVVGTKFAFRGYEELSSLANIDVVSDPKAYKSALVKAVSAPLTKRKKNEIAQSRIVLWDERLKNLQKELKSNNHIWKPTLYIDVTQLYKSRALTGIQRVVRSLLPPLLSSDGVYETRAIFYDDTRDKYAVFDNDDMVHLATSLEVGILHPTHEISIADIADGDIFFDLDLVWNSKPKRNQLYRELHSNGAVIYTYIYDLTPILIPHRTHPETNTNFPSFLNAVCEYSDLVLTDSRSSERDFVEYREKYYPERYVPTLVTRLGSDFALKTKRGLRKKEIRRLVRKKYLLFVGTLEPRKGQKLLFDSFKDLESRHKDLHLVFVGRKGWKNDEFIGDLTGHKLFGKRIHWLQGVDDYELERLYRHSFMNVYLSEYEGYGLPIAESLNYGKPIIASKNSSMYEVGRDFADYVTYGTKNEIVDLVNYYLDSKELYKKKTAKIKKYYRPTTWNEVFSTIDSVITDHFNPMRVGELKKLQHVCISIRAEDFKRCVRQTDRHVKFLKEYIVITKGDLISEFSKIKSKHKIHIIDEKHILGEHYQEFKKAPHQQKNWLLRAAIPNINILDDEFIMLDDDNLPLKDVTLENYVEGNRYKAYYYNDLLSWKHLMTSYDVGQHETTEALLEGNLQLLSYSSHMPQIINKRIYERAINRFKKEAVHKELDEWSTYFNYATTRYPEQFEKRIYQTLNWPAHPGNWQVDYVPDKYVYENYYDHIYSAYQSFQKIGELGDYRKKIAAKKKQIKPYDSTTSLMREAFRICANENMVHGTLVYEGHASDRVIISSIPYIFAGVTNVTLKHRVAFKIINAEPGAVYELVLQNSAGSTLGVELATKTKYVVDGLVEGVVELPVQIALKGTAIKDLNFAVKKNGTDMRAKDGRYDSAMVICQGKQTVKEALSKLTTEQINKFV